VSSNWIEQAEAALRGQVPPDVELLTGHRPVLLDAQGRRAVIAPFFAAFMWAAVVFRAGIAQSLDPISLLLRMLALALSVRALLLGAQFVRRIGIYRKSGRYALVLCNDGLLLRTPVTDFAVPKTDIVDIRERGLWQESGTRRWADVYVITRPASGRTHIALPPLFERTPGVLAERLMRWRGAVEPSALTTSREPAELASKLYDAVATGERPEGVSVLLHGRSWLRRGPYATVLLGFAVLDGFLRLPTEAQKRVTTLVEGVVMLCVGFVPALWYLMTRADIAPRKGIALLLTPAELMLRTRAGVHRVSWPQVARLEIVTGTSWSILLGPHESRSLVIHRKDDDTISYTEAFLGAPCEVVVALCEGYRKSVLP